VTMTLIGYGTLTTTSLLKQYDLNYPNSDYPNFDYLLRSGDFLLEYFVTSVCFIRGVLYID